MSLLIIIFVSVLNLCFKEKLIIHPFPQIIQRTIDFQLKRPQVNRTANAETNEQRDQLADVQRIEIL